MRKIKVLRIIARLNIGGPARHVAVLNEGLEKKRFDSSLIYGKLAGNEGDMSYLAEGGKAKSIFIPELSRDIRPVRDLRAFMRIFSIIKSEKPDIVHTHTAKAGTIGRLAAILARVPIKVHTFHGHIFYGYFSRLLTAAFLQIEKALAFFTDRIVAVSDIQKEELLRKYRIGKKTRYSVINLGFELERFLDPERYKGGLRKKLALKNDALLIGIVGRLEPVKNHEMFLNVAWKLKRSLAKSESEKIKFIVIGDGPRRARLMNYAKAYGLEKDVFFTGWIKNMPEAYADLDIVALTSRNEGTPLSLIEALASARCVISTDVGGVKDVVGDAGILVGENDEGAFVRGLGSLIEFPGQRKEFGERGRERVLKRFSRENLISGVEKLYEELLKEKGIYV